MALSANQEPMSVEVCRQCENIQLEVTTSLEVSARNLLTRGTFLTSQQHDNAMEDEMMTIVP